MLIALVVLLILILVIPGLGDMVGALIGYAFLICCALVVIGILVLCIAMIAG